MIVDRNGIRVDINRTGRTVTFQVLDQTKEATQALQSLGHVRDETTGITLRSNKAPSYNRKIKRFFVRGSKAKKHNETVTVENDTVEQAQQMLDALPRLLEKVTPLGKRKAKKGRIIIGAANIAEGGTTHVRMSLIPRGMAQKLQLTGHDLYPDEVATWQPCGPAVTGNAHWDEHQGQIVDVLNKSVSNKQDVDADIVNPHRVTPKQARAAAQAFRRMLDDADKGNYLVAFWRVWSGIRHCDVEE